MQAVKYSISKCAPAFVPLHHVKNGEQEHKAAKPQ